MKKQIPMYDIINLIEKHQEKERVFYDNYKSKNPDDKRVDLAHGAVLSELASLLYDLKRL